MSLGRVAAIPAPSVDQGEGPHRPFAVDERRRDGVGDGNRSAAAQGPRDAVLPLSACEEHVGRAIRRRATENALADLDAGQEFEGGVGVWPADIDWPVAGLAGQKQRRGLDPGDLCGMKQDRRDEGRDIGRVGRCTLDCVEQFEFVDALFELLGQAVEFGVARVEPDLEVQGLERDGRLCGEGLEEVLIVDGEVAGALVQHLDDADDLPIGRPHRHAQHRPGAIARQAVELGVEGGVEVGVLEIDRSSAGGDEARNTVPDGDADHHVGLALNRQAPQHVLLGVVLVDRRAIRLEQGRDLGDDGLHRAPRLPASGQVRGDGQHTGEAALSRGEGRLQGFDPRGGFQRRRSQRALDCLVVRRRTTLGRRAGPGGLAVHAPQ